MQKPLLPAIAPGQLEALAAQIEQGKQLFADKCVECHGPAAQGTDDGPALVGKNVLLEKPAAGSKREIEFHTVGDVYVFAMRNMPADDPASLTADQYLAVIAFVASANGVKLERPLDATTAGSLVLHP
jgi:mono/diheme cytochrome c family protein